VVPLLGLIELSTAGARATPFPVGRGRDDGVAAGEAESLGAVVDGATGLVLARESREDHPADLDLSAAASAQVLRAHRLSARNMGLSDQIDEVMVSAGPRQQVLRTIGRYPDLFLLALLDKHRANLALARYKLMEIEKSLA